jgi:glycosyltransferase involved in cell wall biosynthesis
MRVAIVSMTQCITTQDSRVFREASSLKEAGYDVLVIGLLKRGSDALTEDEYEGVKILRLDIEAEHRDIGIVRILLYPLFIVNRWIPKYWANSIKRRMSPLARFAMIRKVIDSMIGNVLAMILWHRMAGPQQYFASYRFAEKAYEIIKHFDADVFHGHDLPTMPLGYWCKRKLGCKVIYDNHELWVDRNTTTRPRWLWRSIDRLVEGFVIHRSDAVLVVGDSIAKIMAERYHVPITTLHNYPMPQRGNYSLKKRLNIPESQKAILYLGLITPNRGVEQSIKVLRLLPDYVLVLMGYYLEDWYSEEIRELISQQEVGCQVYFMPAVPFDQVTAWASTADVSVVLQAAKWKSYELSFPNKLLESVVAGLPVVVNEQCSDMVAFVLDNQVGKAVNIKNIPEISRAIKSVVDNPAYALNSEDLSDELSWHEEVKKLLEIYGRF